MPTYTLTDGAERAVLDGITGANLLTRIEPPLFMRLMTVNGSESAAGTEVVGDLYDQQQLVFDSAATVSGTTTAATSSATIFPGLSSTSSISVVGYEIWDNSETPVRVWAVDLGGVLAVPANQPVTFAAGTITVGGE